MVAPIEDAVWCCGRLAEDVEGAPDASGGDSASFADGFDFLLELKLAIREKRLIGSEDAVAGFFEVACEGKGEIVWNENVAGSIAMA